MAASSAHTHLVQIIPIPPLGQGLPIWTERTASERARAGSLRTPEGKAVDHWKLWRESRSPLVLVSTGICDMHRIVMLSERLHACVADRTAPETSGAPCRAGSTPLPRLAQWRFRQI